ncbi:MAG: PRC-barrel domain-containing protein [Candidatus Altiarchaeota archaeon]|nr:PRC-barrel domain-containing protein [Candidatus Altiarchaeota archaeon]
MSKKVSELYGLDIYSTDGTRIGRVEDVLLNLDEGVVMSLYLQMLNAAKLDSGELKRIITEEGISYEGITSVGDIVLTKEKAFRKSVKSRNKKVMESEEMVSVSMG